MKYYINTEEYSIVEFIPKIETKWTNIDTVEILAVEYWGSIKKPKQFRKDKTDKWIVYPNAVSSNDLMTIKPEEHPISINYEISNGKR